MTEQKSEKYRPIFGTYCRTCAYTPNELAQNTASDDPHKHITYLEAYEDDPITGTWLVNRVEKKLVEKEIKGEKRLLMGTKTRAQASKLTFANALKQLADYESMHDDPISKHTRVGETPEELGSSHFYHFGVREGFIFDVNGRMHTRPNEHALPADALFDDTELDKANAIWRETKSQRQGPAPIPLAHDSLLSEIFIRAASKGNLDDARVNNEALVVLDKFYEELNDVNSNLQSYVDNFRELGQSHYIENAMEGIERAADQLDELKPLNIDPSGFNHFLQYLNVYTFVTHAQALYTLNNEKIFRNTREYSEKVQIKENNKSMDRSIKEATKIAYKLGATNEEGQMLKASVQTTPSVPQSLTNYISSYKERRSTWKDAMQQGKKVTIEHMMPAGVR